ncbi:MAG: hypothetical protein E7Z96_05420 [Actinomycetaceae bacterium]|nr:hypothetical protein [Actinomycetaceae bacterium]
MADRVGLAGPSEGIPLGAFVDRITQNQAKLVEVYSGAGVTLSLSLSLSAATSGNNSSSRCTRSAIKSFDSRLILRISVIAQLLDFIAPGIPAAFASRMLIRSLADSFRLMPEDLRSSWNRPSKLLAF